MRLTKFIKNRLKTAMNRREFELNYDNSIQILDDSSRF